MTIKEISELKDEFGKDMKVTKAVRLHDEDEWNEYVISYKDNIVGSELVSADFVRAYIKEIL